MIVALSHARKFAMAMFAAHLAFAAAGCSLPTLQSEECLAARDVVRQYYSLAIGGELDKQPDALARIKSLMSPGFTAGPRTTEPGRDAYNFSLIQPTSSRLGECAVTGEGRVRMDASVIWRANNENAERRDTVELKRSGESWLIEKIEVGTPPGPQY